MKLEKNTLVTDEDGNKFYVYNTVNYKEKQYAVCVEYDNPKKFAVFEYKYNNEELMIRKENNQIDIPNILANSLKRGE